MANTQQYIVEILGKDKTSQAFKQVTGNVDKAKQSVLTLKNAIVALGTGVAVRSIINTTARFQDLRTALSSVTGSAEAGAEAFGFISKFATQTQFGVDDLTETFIKLSAAGIKPTRELLTTFTDTAAVTTDQLGSLQAITDLFARSVSGGLGLEDLNRLADRGVPVFKILEEQLGLTRLEVSKFGQTARGAEKIRDALVQGLNKSFGGATADRVKNLSTQISNLGIAFTNAQDVLGQGLSAELGTAIDNVTDFINVNEELIRQLGEGLGKGINAGIKGVENLVENFDLLKEIFIAIIGLKVAIVIAQITTNIKGLTSAMALLNGVISRNPIFVIGGTAITAVALFGDKIKLLKDDINDLKININGSTEELNEFRNSLQNLDIEQQIRGYETLAKSIELEMNKSKELIEVLEDQGTIRRNGLDTVIANTDAISDYSYENEALFKLAKELYETENKILELRKLLERQTNNNTDSTDDNTNSLQKNIDKQKESLDLIKKTLDARRQFEEETMAKIRQFDPARAEIEAEANKQVELEKLRNQGYISEQKYKVLSEDLTKQSNQRLYELFKQGKLDELDFARISEETKQSIFLNSARDILGQLSQTNKKAFEIYKAFAISDAIVSTYQGVAKALAKGFPLGYIEAGITLAKGFAQVSAIRSQSFQGRALGGRVQEGKQYMVGEQGAEMFIPDQSGTIVANKNLGGATNVNITINANDTEGFDDLLIKRRSTIINVINDALNSQGREAII
jgi:hypothetical protein